MSDPTSTAPPQLASLLSLLSVCKLSTLEAAFPPHPLTRAQFRDVLLKACDGTPSEER